MSSSNDDPDSHYESKLAAAGYNHKEVLENVHGFCFDQDDSHGSLLDVEQEEGQQDEKNKSKTAEANSPCIQHQPSSWSPVSRTTMNSSPPNIVGTTPNKDDKTMESLDQIQKEAILLAFSNDDEIAEGGGKYDDYTRDDVDALVEQSNQEIDNGDNNYGSIRHSAGRLVRSTSAARSNGKIPTDAGIARSLHHSPQYRSSSTVPGAYSMVGATPLSRGTTGLLTPMPVDNKGSSVHLAGGNEVVQQSNTNTSDFQDQEGKRGTIQRNSRVMVLLLVICVATIGGVGVGMWMRGRRKDPESSATTVPTTATIPLELERMLQHCSSTSDGDALLMDEHLASLSDQDRSMYSKYVEAFSDANLHTMYSCRPDNLAVLYLTMDEEGNMDQLQSSTFELRNATITKYSLAFLFISWFGLSWTNNDRWLTSDPVCKWHGVECSAQSDLISLDLSENILQGTIPSEISLLTSLQHLNLKNREISRGSGLSGSIPTNLFAFSDLKTLMLNNNQLSGPLPTEIGLCSKMTTFDFDGNLLSGSLPSELGLCSNMSFMSLSYNPLTGSLPSEIGLCSKMTTLNFGSNLFSGSLPSELGLCSNMSFMSLSSNRLTGSLPSEIGLCSKMTTLNFGRNLCSGSLPSELGLCSNMKEISLPSNRLTGSLPSEIGLCSKMTTLDFGNNVFSGSLPSELGLCSNMKRISLYYNLLTGSLPSEIGLPTSLEVLDVGVNKLNGTIPESIGSCTALQSLDISGNDLSGTIPDDALGQLVNLGALYVSDNNLSGSISSDSRTGLCERAKFGVLETLFVDCREVSCDDACGCSCIASVLP